MHKILAVIASTDLHPVLLEAMGKEYDITICGTADEAALLLQQEYDGMILDLFLPGTDGLTFLENIQNIAPPVILILSRLVTPYILQAVQSLGGGYVIRVPCSGKAIKNRLADMLQKFEMPDPTSSLHTAQYHLHRLKVSTSWIGYHHMVTILTNFDFSRNSSLFKDFYPALARENSVTVDAIDNAIHKAIARAYARRNDTIWREYFPGTEGCPKNKEFISAVAERMR